MTDYHIPIKQLQDWFQADIVSRKRYEIQQLLHRLMLEQGINLEALNLPLLNLRPEGKLVEYSGTEDDEDEDDDDQLCEEEEEIMEDDGVYHDDMGEEDEEMEEGEIGHHHDDEEDSEHYLDLNMDLEDHDDMSDYCMDEEDDEIHEDDEEEEMTQKEMDELSSSHLNHMKGDGLKGYRIPRLANKCSTNNTFKEEQLE